MKNLTIVLFVGVLFKLVSCSQSLNESGTGLDSSNQSELLSFSCEKSFEHFLDLDSILTEIPDTFGFKHTATGDSIDWRLNKALRVQSREWGKYYKNPTITTIRKERKSSFITVEFTGGGGYDFNGSINCMTDTLFLLYSVAGDRKTGRSKDTRYILVYEVKSEMIEGREISVEYKDSLIKKTN